ncbi:putative beta-ketoacyl-[acyl-carrier-protein] synthase I [Seiridium unicorne]|uniref:beta-ketoacyl-[acyl-carrier-protein] synthase I n=1 Tax=Seiridium unicorne TaxID=138068 RepID=A0ABR2VCS7_9PEZI
MTASNHVRLEPEGGKARTEQQRAYALLTELLTHQFAFPVQWIDTQKELFASDRNIRRFIEIGPASVLAPIAKKSAKKLVGDQDAARLIEREYLNINNIDDSQKIYYEYGENSLAVSETTSSNDAPSSAPVRPDNVKTLTGPIIPVSEAAPIAVVSVPTAPATIVDKDLTATDLLVSLVAQKLRRAFDKVPLKESIQQLSGGEFEPQLTRNTSELETLTHRLIRNPGKSTLQNELLGDLAAEFGELPDASENTPIDDLGEKLASGFSGKPGKSTKRLIDRFISSKMPGGFGHTEMATYLASRRGLGLNIQTAVQCFCATMEPASRLSDVAQVHEFLDSVVDRYVKYAGVSLPAQSSSGAVPGLQNTVVQVDSGSLEALKNEQNKVLWQQLRVLAQHLGVNVAPEVGNGSKINDDAQQQLDELNAELDEEFLSGTKGVFDPKKSRRYSSWWNWGREHAARLLQHDRTAVSAQDLQVLMNRWTPELDKMLQYSSKPGEAREMAVDLLRSRTGGGVPVFRFTEEPLAPRTSIDEHGHIQYREVSRRSDPDPCREKMTYYDFVSLKGRVGSSKSHVHCLRRGNDSWQYDSELTGIYLDALLKTSTCGVSYSGKTALVTGVGVGGIGIEVVRGLLSGGARVIVTTSRPPAVAGGAMAQLYKEAGSSESELILLPFNAASKKDVQGLVAHIYDKSKGLGIDLDFMIPFAAIPEPGREIEGIDGRSEMAHRAMLINVLRMLGSIKQEKEKRGYGGRPTTVLLPLSPNHGEFGGDGLYSESKIGLETLFNRYHSEHWSDYLSIVGAAIGWTRGTGLMGANDIVAEGIEKLGVVTFTSREMAANILALFNQSVIELADLEPVYADLSGGLMNFPHLKDEIMAIRKGIKQEQVIRQAILSERRRHEEILGAPKVPFPRSMIEHTAPKKRSSIRQGFPTLSSHQDMTADLDSLLGMVDLSRTVVVVGFSELGPWGSSRTRWQMESQGKLDTNGLTEMAWMMNLVKHHDGLVDGRQYVGWLDTKSGKPVEEDEFAARYGEFIMNHSGIRVMEPESLDGYDPAKKELLHEVVLDEDLPPFTTSKSIAQSFKLHHGDNVDIVSKAGDPESWVVTVKRGAAFLVPRSSDGNQFVAAQLPKGWNAATYGISEDIISQVDPITLYVLCCVCEAMYSAGIEDPFELYKHIHVSEFENCIGTGAGGLRSMRDMYRHRYRDSPVQGDILQETFLNSMAAWTNMLLFGATGPIKTPTGTCATAIESLDNACEGIRSRRVKVALVGGTDDLQEEVSHEFTNMKATVVAEEEIAKGFLPAQMSRPMTSSRAGFVESAGCGVQIVTSAELALQMGLPIYCVVAYSQMAGDGVGRSVPAPGQGIMTAARETAAAAQSPLLDLGYRRSKLERDLETMEGRRLPPLADTTQTGTAQEAERSEMMETASTCHWANTQWMWNGDIRQLDPSISPIRASLAVWGLTIDDIGIASFHGTSTRANDKNESSVVHEMMTHLGRTEGNPLLVICQKYLTGHPKGGAGAWMMNGCMQVLESRLVPGNRNADDIDGDLRAFTHLLYPSEVTRVRSVKAFMLTSFGFGQKGGIVIGVTPRALFAALSASNFERYRERVDQRQHRADRAFRLAMMTNSVVKAKDKSVWAEKGRPAGAVFLDPGYRV